VDVIGVVSLRAIHLHLAWWTWALLAAVVLLALFERERRATRRARHRAYLHSPAWRTRRQAALARAGWRCEDCGHTERLHVHHLTYRRWGHEADDDLRVLCSPCHARRHRGGRLKRVA
jgi:5-methylcytosine-specific restriction endonuclease McrA